MSSGADEPELSNTRPCYQLAASGDSINGWRFNARSQLIFTSLADAEAHIPEFRRRCLDEEFLDYALPEGLDITINKLELLG